MDIRKITISSHASSFSLLIISLTIFYLSIRGHQWPSKPTAHTIMEAAASLLARPIALFTLIYHKRKRDPQMLVIGGAFAASIF